MSRVSIIPEDRMVVVDGLGLTVPNLPAIDPNWRALQYYPDSKRLTIECHEGSKDPISGDAAWAIVLPFVDAWASANSQLLQQQAGSQPEGTEGV